MKRIHPPPSPVCHTMASLGGGRSVNTPTGTMCNIVNEAKDDQTDKPNTMGNEEENANSFADTAKATARFQLQ